MGDVYTARDGQAYPVADPSASGCGPCRIGHHADCESPDGDCGVCHPVREDWSWLGVGPDDDGAGLDRWAVEVDWADEMIDPAHRPAVGTRIDLPMGLGLEVTVVAEHGPGGGWPVVRAVGPYHTIMSFLAEYHDDPRIATLSVEELEGRTGDELDADTVEAAGLDASGRSGDPRFPFTWDSLTDDERARVRLARLPDGERAWLNNMARLIVGHDVAPTQIADGSGAELEVLQAVIETTLRLYRLPDAVREALSEASDRFQEATISAGL